MAFKVLFVSRVPNDSVPHFNQTDYGLLISKRAQQLLVEYKTDVIYFRSELSTLTLTLTTEMIFKNESAYRSMIQRLSSDFPEFSERRAEYTLANNIEIEHSESEI
jgi:hypothetical protein